MRGLISLTSMDDMQKEIDELKHRLSKLEEYHKQANNLENNMISLSDFCQLLMDDIDVLTERIKKFGENNSVPADEAFTKDFMCQHTKVSSFEEFLRQGGYGTDAESFKAIPDDEFDEYVRNNSDFACWRDMLKSSATNYTLRQLSGGLNFLSIKADENKEEE